MTDALRSDRSSPGRDLPDRERDSRIEALLLTGLDHYFAGRHEMAISVWSRVLFLDRAHAKARAYIDRARSALAERQREGDELFHTGAEALSRGDTAAARELLTSAVEQGANGDEALILLHRLDRLDAATTGIPAQPRQTEEDRTRVPEANPRGDQRVVWMVAGILAGVLIAVVAGAYIWIVADPLEMAPRRPVAVATEDPVPVPTAGELRLLRARALVARGRLHEALVALEQGSTDERARAATDELRAAIQRRLLEEAGAARTASPGPRSSAR